MDKQRTENMASDDAEKFMRDIRASKVSEEDTGLKPGETELKESALNEEHRLFNQRSQRNAEHDAKYGDASDGERSRLPKDQRPEDAHVPQG